MVQDEETTVSHTLSGESFAPRVSPSVSLLICHRNGVQGVELAAERPLTVGRVEPADVVIRDGTLSRSHARFELIDNEVWVEDLGSTNGTRLNGKRVKRSKLRVNDEVTLGSVVVALHMITTTGVQLQGLDSHDRFLHALEEEVVRAKTFGRPLSLVMVREANRDDGKLHRWCPRVRELIRPVDRMALYGPNAVELLLPESNQAQAEAVARIVVGGRRAGEPALLCGIATYPMNGTSGEELLEVSRKLVLQADDQQPVRIAAETTAPAAATSKTVGDGQQWLVQSPKMEEVQRTVEKLAKTAIPTLIIGETGTGKEVIARAIHYTGARKDQALRCINCGAIPESLIESVLFGHERGAFTGAERRTKGVFEEAGGGTVLLDEIGELAPQAQAALLRVLETKRITRVGASQEIPVDVRILAATHRDLESMCEQQTFRWDLLYRLNTMTLKIPPLRERTEEIEPLAEHFLNSAAEANGCEVHGIDPDALEVLQAYSWPGNIRELRNVIERAVVIARGPLITVEDLSERIRQAAANQTNTRRRRVTQTSEPESFEAQAGANGTNGEAIEERTVRFRPSSSHLDFKRRLQQFEVALILRALEKTDGNKTEAASALGMPRRTLIYKLQQGGGNKENWKPDDEMVAEAARQSNDEIDFKQRVQQFEEILIRDALSLTDGNQAKAARLLRMPVRTFSYKVKEYGLKD